MFTFQSCTFAFENIFHSPVKLFCDYTQQNDGQPHKHIRYKIRDTALCCFDITGFCFWLKSFGGENEFFSMMIKTVL